MNHDHDLHPSAETLQAFLDGEMPSRALRRVEEHLSGCAHCAGEVESWGTLFSDLEELATLRPHEGFHDRVMMGVQIPEPAPLAARVKDRLTAFVPGAETHLSPDRIHDLLEGFLPARQVSTIRDHLDACATCASDVRGWETVYRQLDGLGHVAPSEEFAEAVMAAVELAPAPVPARAVLAGKVLAVARRLVPQTRRAWAALSGVAVTPAVTAGLVLYAVFSHPALTPGSLAAFAWWQVSDAVSALGGTLSGFATNSVAALGLGPVLQTVFAAPLLWGLGFVVYSAACAFALRVLYTHLIASHPFDGRYARASLS